MSSTDLQTWVTQGRGSKFDWHTDLWVDDFIAGLVKEGQQLLMHRALLSVTAGWAHHAGDARGGIHHLAGQPLLGLLRHPGVHVQLGRTLKQNHRQHFSEITARPEKPISSS